jgi:PAS domain S-box-containing protein
MDAAATSTDGARLAGLSAQLQSLRRVALAVAQAGGPGLFDALARELAEALEVPTVFIAVFSDNACSLMRTLAVRLDGRTLQNFDYGLEGTPCALVVGREFRYMGSGVAAQFPPGSLFAAKGMDAYAAFPLRDSGGEALGLLVAMDRKPIAGGDAEHAEAMLKIVAGRVAAEIERGRTDEALRSAALAVSASRGGTVFDELVRLLATILHVEVAFIARHEPGDPPQLRMLAMHCDGQIVRDVRYGLAGTPCETVLGQQFRAYPNDLQALFPDDEDARATCTVSYAGYPLTSTEGAPLGVLSVASRRPLTQVDRVESMLKIFAMRAAAEVERLAASEALQRSEARLRATVEAAFDCVIGMDGEGRIVEFNAAAERVFGYRREEVLGKPVAETIVPERRREAHRRWVREFPLTGSGPMLGRLVESTALTASGEEIPVELAVSMAEAPEGRIFVGHVRDISARREAEQARLALEAQLRQAQKMEAIGQLTGGIAHDFNNILTSVIGYLVLGEERAEALGDPMLQRQLGQAHLAAQRARDLIAQMLAFARRQRGEAKVLDVGPLVRQTLRLLRATLPSSVTLGGNAGVDELPAPLCVAVDPVQLEQVLFNLCINARDALEGSAGRISVHLHAHAQQRWQCASCRAPVDGGPWVELSVADSGSGIAPELLERIFDPFFSTKAPGSGSGMGLAMVHGIVHGHGGHLRVQTVRGHGSVFSVMLPRAAAAAAPAPAEPAPRRPAAADGPALRGNVLVVEDDPMVGDFLVERLASWGLRVRLLREPQTAAAWLAEPAHEADLMITDQTMPHMTGLQLAARSRALRPSLPVVLISGNAGAFDPQELAQCGVHTLLRKPIDAERLRAVLGELLSVAAA